MCPLPLLYTSTPIHYHTFFPPRCGLIFSHYIFSFCAAKSAQSHNLGKSGDIQRGVKLRKEDERPLVTLQGDSHRASPTQNLTSSKKDSQPIDSADKLTSANDASKRSTDDISKDFGKSSENEEPKSVSISEASNKDEIKSNEEEPSSSEISDGNKSDNSVLSSDNTSDKKREYNAEFLRSLQNSKQALQKPALNLKGSGPRIYDTVFFSIMFFFQVIG